MITHTWIVDQITDDSVAVEVDGERVIHVPRQLLPKRLREGDVLQVETETANSESVIRIVRDIRERQRRLATSKRQVAKGKDTERGNIVL